MPPRAFTLPKATTASAKAARAAFFCELCQKGYSRMNEFEAHESSYDHQHKKRLKEMKEMQRQVQSSNKKEEKGPLMSIKLGSGTGKKSGGVGSGEKGQATGGAGFKKGGFKNAFAPADDDENNGHNDDKKAINGTVPTVGKDLRAQQSSTPGDEIDSDVTDVEDYYDPQKPTGCHPGCPNRT